MTFVTDWHVPGGPTSYRRPGGDYGVPLAYAREIAGYWADGYDWRTHEADLNTLPQFMTTIDGADVHFLHARSLARMPSRCC